MNILIVSTSDIYGGGAALAAFRLMRALNSGGENVKMLVRDKRSNDPDVFVVGNQLKSRWNFYFERGSDFFYKTVSQKKTYSTFLSPTLAAQLQSYPYSGRPMLFICIGLIKGCYP